MTRAGALTNRSLYATLVREADPAPARVETYRDGRGRSPFSAWLSGLDVRARARVRVRLERLSLGNWGDWRSVGDGVVELRIHYGPGLRVYIGRETIQAVILLGGGAKDTQADDIRRAKERWADHLGRSHGALG